ncbi:hypothetical protein Tco_1403213 [Tanacetum coccineum]
MEDTAYPCLHSPKTKEDKAQYAVSRETQYAVFKNEYGMNIIFWKISSVAPTLRNPQYAVSNSLDMAYRTDYQTLYIDDLKLSFRLEEEKARRRGKVYNWETATYGKIWDNEDVHGLRSVETEFPAIVFNDTLTPEELLCKPTVSSLNNDEINFRISFDESDDEDCTNEFSAIVYNDAQTSQLDFLTEPTLSPQNIDKIDLKNETSLSECDGEEQNVLNFNNLFPFNVLYPDDSKSDKDNDDDKVDIEHSSEDLSVKPLPDVINTDVGAYAHGSNKLLETIYTAYSLNEYRVYDTGLNTAYPGEWIRRIDFLYSFSESEEQRTTEGIIWNYYDCEVGETTPRFEE